VTSEEKENLEKKFKDQKNNLDILKDIFCWVRVNIYK
jgi:hypothetical protein